MSLLTELKENAAEREIYAAGAKNVCREISSEHRWYNRVMDVFERDGEFVAVFWDEPSTEMQEDQDYNAEVYAVEPYEATVTKYRRV